MTEWRFLAVLFIATTGVHMSPSVPRFLVHFEVEVGVYLTVEDLAAAVWASGNHIHTRVRDLLSSVVISDRKKLRIVVPSVKRLGFFAERTDFQSIYARGIELGYEPIPQDLPLSLMCQRLPRKKYYHPIRMAMKALGHPDGSMNLLDVRPYSGDEFMLCGFANSEGQYTLCDLFAFVDPRS